MITSSYVRSSIVPRRGPTAIGLSATFYIALAALLEILGSNAAEGELFSSHFIVRTGVRLDLRRIMFEDRPYDVVRFPPPHPKSLPNVKSWHANWPQLAARAGDEDNVRFVSPKEYRFLIQSTTRTAPFCQEEPQPHTTSQN
jgi:hypothetical protein